MVNRSRPHVLVLPEDYANDQLLTGFLLEFDNPRQVQALEAAGGWRAVLDRFNSNEASGMDRYPDRLMVLLLDFDGRSNRLAQVQAAIPKHLTDRVFVLGAWTEPEDLRRANLGSYEAIGRSLANDCRHNANTTWEHELLRHNAYELARFCARARPILFPDSD